METPIRDVFPMQSTRLAMDGDTTAVNTRIGSLAIGTDQQKITREEQLIRLYDELRPSLLSYLGGLGLSFHEAEDVLHESFLRLFDQRAQKKEHVNPRGWLFRVAHNLSMDFFRSGKRYEQAGALGKSLVEALLATSDGPEENAIRNEQTRRVHAALGRLTAQQRAAVLLRAEDLRYREIAEILGVSIKRVSDLIHRALARLTGEI